MGTFRHAHNFTLSQAQFIDQSNHITGPRSGFDILLESSAPEAAYDSYSRRYVPPCFPGTREQHIKDITDWAAPSLDHAAALPIFRMEGPAGVGKSTIAQSCAERLDDTGNLGASFFFMSNICEDHTCFFPTIAYQLSIKLPDYREILDRKIKMDPTLVKKQLRYQFRDLITRPLSELEKAGKRIGTYVILVDGLNECNDRDAQREIVEVITKGISSQTMPLRWAIFSRPDPQIEAAFADPNIAPICHSVSLLSCEVSGGLELHLSDGLQNVLRREAAFVDPNIVTNDHSSVGVAQLRPNMPSQFNFVGSPEQRRSPPNVGQEIGGTAALYLYPLNDSFAPRHIPFLTGQHVKVGRETGPKTAPGERNGFFASMVLSTQHAEIWEHNGKIFIKDVKSLNGTYLNGERLSPGGVESDPHELKSDDIVEFGIDVTGEDDKTIVHYKVTARAVCVFSEQRQQPYPQALIGAAQPGSNTPSELNFVHSPEPQRPAPNVDPKTTSIEGTADLYLYPLDDSFIPRHISLLTGQRVKIGRETNPKTAPGESNGFFASKVLSTQHAEIWEDNGKIFIKDVKSSNGTYINGERLSPEGVESDPYELKNDDTAEFGTDVTGEDNKTIMHHKITARVVCVFPEQDASVAALAEQQQQQQQQQHPYPHALIGAAQPGPNMPSQLDFVGSPERQQPALNVDEEIAGIEGTAALHLYPLDDSFIPRHISLLAGQRVKVGRGTNPKTAPDEKNGFFSSRVLSAHHAEIWEDDGKIFIKDVKSSNGTFLNGERLSPAGAESDPHELESDDIVEFGFNIVDKENKTIIHHKVTARAVCVFSEQDAQVAARVEQP